MRMPNNVGYVAECLEERPLVRDETGKEVPGDVQVRFKLKLRNTLGKELVVFALLEDQTLREEVDTFLNPKTMVFANNTTEELANQLTADLAGEKDPHDLVVDRVESRIADKIEAEVRKRIDAYLAERLV